MCKLKSYNFWVRLASAVILIARIILSKFGYELDSALVIDVATLIAGLLVVLGIINEPTGITLSYDESKKEDGITCENKGDNYMTEKIKSDLSECIARLGDEIRSGSGSDVSNIVQIITGMLDLILSEVEDRKSDESEDKTIEENSEKDIEVQFEHSSNEFEGLVDGDENVLSQNEQDEDAMLTIDDILPESVVIGTRDDGQLCVAEYVENTDFQGGMSDITATQNQDVVKEKPKAQKFEQLVIKADAIAPELTTETALSILQDNPDGLKQLKEYFLKSESLDGDAV